MPVTQIVQNLEKLTIKGALEKLLELCNQKVRYNKLLNLLPSSTSFASSQHHDIYVFKSQNDMLQMDKNSIPTMESMFQKYVNLNSIQKIGEGTFGEVFKSDGIVIKVVPMEGSTLVSPISLNLKYT